MKKPTPTERFKAVSADPVVIGYPQASMIVRAILVLADEVRDLVDAVDAVATSIDRKGEA